MRAKFHSGNDFYIWEFRRIFKNMFNKTIARKASRTNGAEQGPTPAIRTA